MPRRRDPDHQVVDLQAQARGAARTRTAYRNQALLPPFRQDRRLLSDTLRTQAPFGLGAKTGVGAVNAAQSTATVPNGTTGVTTAIQVTARDQYGNSVSTGGATVTGSVSGATVRAFGKCAAARRNPSIAGVPLPCPTASARSVSIVTTRTLGCSGVRLHAPRTRSRITARGIWPT